MQQKKQQGVVLFIALIMLVAMSIAGVSLMRSVGGGSMVAGNLSLKQATTRAADIGMESAYTWLMATGNDTTINSPANGFFATLQPAFDPFTMGDAWWTANSVSVSTLPSALDEFQSVQYVIHRMCEAVGGLNDAGQQCVRRMVPPEGCSPPAPCLPPTIYPFFRITIRVIGPKNTESFVQVMMY